uniref:Uncharacterized protein n=1 Tax=Cyprinus carpio TaxID=7962 RepID=A0A8C2Q264_CYPCA
DKLLDKTREITANNSWIYLKDYTSMDLVWFIIIGMCAMNDIASACPENCQCKPSKIICQAVVEPHTFDQTRNLVALGFSGTINLLTSLPEDAFQGLEKLGQLMLQRNAIRKLYSSTFRGLSHLKSLFLQQNNLTDIPAGIFDDLVNLEVLHLQDNKITQLPANLFSNLPMLKKLYLSNNRLSLLPGAIFLNLPNLTHISLYENQLSRLMPGTFGPMALQELWLYDNMLTHLEENVFHNLTEIRLLNITSLMCYAPPALNGRNIRELKEDDIMVSQTAAETTVDISPESTQAYSEPTERHLPHTSPTKPSDSTTVSKEIEDTSGGNAVGQGLSKDKLIIILAIVCTAVIVGIITCVLWRRNKRGSQDLELHYVCSSTFALHTSLHLLLGTSF